MSGRERGRTSTEIDTPINGKGLQGSERVDPHLPIVNYDVGELIPTSRSGHVHIGG